MSETQYIIVLPLSIQVSKKDKFYLNLNQYRNTHFHVLNKAKVNFAEHVKPLISQLPKMLKVDITYRLFTGSKRSVDLANICCIVDKFFCDCLTTNEVLPDDNMDIISNIHYEFGQVDKENPRVEAILTNITLVQEEEDNMKITLVESEMKDAITSFIKNQITVKDEQQINISFTAGRGDNGFTAEIDIGGTIKETTPFTATGVVARKAEDVFSQASNGTALQVENSMKEQEKTPEVVTEVAPVVQAEVVPPQSTEPAQTPPQVTPAPTSEQTKVEAPTATPAPRSLFANITAPVHDEKPVTAS